MNLRWLLCYTFYIYFLKFYWYNNLTDLFKAQTIYLFFITS